MKKIKIGVAICLVLQIVIIAVSVYFIMHESESVSDIIFWSAIVAVNSVFAMMNMETISQ